MLARVYLDLIILDDNDTIGPISHVQVCSLDCQQQPSCRPDIVSLKSDQI